MGFREHCIETINENLPVIREEYGVTGLAVFGSVARGEAKDDSDVDILVEMPPKWLKVVGLKLFLEEKLQRSVDLIRRHSALPERFLKIIQPDVITIF